MATASIVDIPTDIPIRVNVTDNAIPAAVKRKSFFMVFYGK